MNIKRQFCIVDNKSDLGYNTPIDTRIGTEMNERIKQLMIQATVREPYYPAGNDGHPEYRTYVSQEKFAELIIRECCLQVADVRIENDFEPVGDAVLVKALAGIKQYFGVE
jgi:hypothetical protein